MNKNTYFKVTAIIFSIIGLAHLYRAIVGVPVTIGAVSIPVYLSWIGVIVAAFLAYQGYTKN